MSEYVEAKATIRVRDMNKLESQYAEHLEMEKRAGNIQWWGFETVKIRLADLTFYTPDFAVVGKDSKLSFHETKGGPWRDDARVKIKVAAETFPAKFIAVKLGKRGWEFEEF